MLIYNLGLDTLDFLPAAFKSSVLSLAICNCALMPLANNSLYSLVAVFKFISYSET